MFGWSGYNQIPEYFLLGYTSGISGKTGGRGDGHWEEVGGRTLYTMCSDGDESSCMMGGGLQV